ncbi:3',5'-cyclic-nucleotide phosphodiesterase pde1 [Recurvomyces mirabilis]|nr:3',5'-cyclic-nucleotide phosphodiesterase pde1 [Recurvomyces mirabilis]
MKDTDNDETPGTGIGLHGQKAALQVICLGHSGGPCEENVTGFLVRSVECGWMRGATLAVDAGSHLAPIVRILERDFPSVSKTAPARTSSDGSLGAEKGNGNGNGSRAPNGVSRGSLSPSPLSEDQEVPPRPEPTILKSGPFAGLKLPNASARANALHILRSYISAYLITHPHLDHFSGFAVNTAGFHATSKPKTLAALPSTVDAIKHHIFNDIIWPNLTDEDGGVGFVTFQRLKEGGDVMVGEGEGRGYIDVVEGLGVRALKVSHGVCTKGPPSHHHRGSIHDLHEAHPFANSEAPPQMSRSLSASHHAQFSAPGTPGPTPRQSFYASNQPSPRLRPADTSCVVDSTAFFIRENEMSREVLIFGDVEPDSISLSPRNHTVWQEAARKIVHGVLGGIFIECSYDDSQADAVLFGHLCPRHLIDELQTLANMVIEARTTRAREKNIRKRKRSQQNGLETAARHAIAEVDNKRSRSAAGGGRPQPRDIRRSSVPDAGLWNDAHMTSPATEQSNPMESSQRPQHYAVGSVATSPRSGQAEHSASRTSQLVRESSQSDRAGQAAPLEGIKVVIIHIKDTMKDGPHVSEGILAQLQAHEDRLRSEGQALGCEFVISESGESYWF